MKQEDLLKEAADRIERINQELSAEKTKNETLVKEAQDKDAIIDNFEKRDKAIRCAEKLASKGRITGDYLTITKKAEAILGRGVDLDVYLSQVDDIDPALSPEGVVVKQGSHKNLKNDPNWKEKFFGMKE